MKRIFFPAGEEQRGGKKKAKVQKSASPHGGAWHFPLLFRSLPDSNKSTQATWQCTHAGLWREEEVGGRGGMRRRQE